MIKKTTTADTLIETFADNGIKIFPVKPSSKHPAVDGWPEKATTNEKLIRKWWAENPDYNVGILLGPGSGACDIEFDSEEGRETADRLLADLPTIAYTSARSTHRLYRMPESPDVPKKAKIDVQGLEIRLGYKAAFSVAPPSTHPSGAQYKWVEGCSLGEIDIAEFPKSVLDLIKSEHTDSTDNGPAAANEGERGREGELLKYSLDSLDDIPEGNRHSELCRTYGQDLKRHGNSPELTASLFEAGHRIGLPATEIRNEVFPISYRDERSRQSNTGSKFVSLREVAASVKKEIEEETTAKPFYCGDGEFEKFCLLPKTITLIGAQPGTGKTALVTQMVFDALKHDPSLSALIANVEVCPQMLFKRQLSRYAAVGFSKIICGDLSSQEKVELLEAEQELNSLNVAFDSRPLNVDFILDRCMESKPDIVVLDYAQRFISRENGGSDKDIVAVMQMARRIADLDAAVILVSATNRHSSGKPDLAAFRDSSELEYGADDAFIMTGDHSCQSIRLTHLKARSRMKKNIELEFYGQFQRFESPQYEEEPEQELSDTVQGCEAVESLETVDDSAASEDAQNGGIQ